MYLLNEGGVQSPYTNEWSPLSVNRLLSYNNNNKLILFLTLIKDVCTFICTV